MTEKLEIYIIEIDKVKKLFKQEPNNKAYQWVMFLDDPNSEEVNYIMQKNEDISDIREDLAIVSGDEELRELTRLKEKREHDRLMIESYELSKKKSIEEAEYKFEERQQMIQEVEQKLQEKQQKIQEADQKFEEKQQKIREVEQGLQEKHQRLQEVEQKIQKAEQKLQEEQPLPEERESLTKEIAVKLLKAGMTFEQVGEITGLAREKIEELQKNEMYLYRKE